MLPDTQMQELDLKIYVPPKKRETLEEKLGDNMTLMGMRFMQGRFEKPHQAFIENMVIHAENITPLTELFGKREGVFRDHRNNSFWRIVHKGYVFTIYTAVEKGTDLEINPEPVEDNLITVDAAAESFHKTIFNLLAPYYKEDIEKIDRLRDERYSGKLSSTGEPLSGEGQNDR